MFFLIIDNENLILWFEFFPIPNVNKTTKIAPWGIALDHAEENLFIGSYTAHVIHKINIQTCVARIFCGKPGEFGFQDGLVGRDCRFKHILFLHTDPYDDCIWVDGDSVIFIFIFILFVVSHFELTTT